MRTVYRYRVAVSDRPQAHRLTSDPVHVEAARVGVGSNAPHVVDFWTEHDDDRPEWERFFQVFGTGHPVPQDARYWGTTARTADGLVWHLYEVTP